MISLWNRFASMYVWVLHELWDIIVPIVELTSYRKFEMFAEVKRKVTFCNTSHKIAPQIILSILHTYKKTASFLSSTSFFISLHLFLFHFSFLLAPPVMLVHLFFIFHQYHHLSFFFFCSFILVSFPSCPVLIRKFFFPYCDAYVSSTSLYNL